MIIRPLGQSGYVLKTERSEIIIDPYLSDSVNRIAGRPRLLPIPISPESISCDAVICTHNHLDHLDPDTVAKIDLKQLFITTNSGKEMLLSLGRENVIAINEGECVKVGDFEITAVFADHTVEAFGLIVKAKGKTLYFSGDTLYNERLFDIAKYSPDVTFICINGKLGNMNVEEALAIAKRLRAKINVPNHYDMFASNAENPHLFADRIDGGMIMNFDVEYQI
ncbi:MAG: MBL fold metallo-hydrolase [Ruminococcaceae bacterium]|nr:MBL fold metallo-hydrolase [Oscillospiraceae bacterium]